MRKEVQEKPKFWRGAKQLDAALGEAYIFALPKSKMKLNCLLVFLAFTVVALVQAKSADSWKMETMLVSLNGKFAEVKTAGSDVIAYKNSDPQLAIEWGMIHGRNTVVLPGKYLISDRIDIPRPGVTLIISKDASIELLEDTQHTTISFGSLRNPGYWQIVPLIYNQGHDNVRVIELGLMVHSVWDKKTSGKQTFPIIFDGRNEEKTCEINGGMMLVTGASSQSFWLVDSKGVEVPMITLDDGIDAVLVLEGSEDCKLGMITNLARTKGGVTGETVDLNSRSTGIEVERLIGERSYEIIDCNESHAVVHEAVLVGEPRKLFGGGVGSGPRFTRRPSHKTHSLDVKKTTIHKDVENVSLRKELPIFPSALPKFDIKASVEVVLKDGSKKVYDKTVTIDLRN